MVGVRLLRRAVVLLLAGSLSAIAPAAIADGVPPPAAVRVELGRFTTSYAIDVAHKSRAFNVELAAEAIDGKVLAPAGTFSFNESVGERTAAFGFTRSVVIRDGMMAEGTGGGTCQVASTLHAAALLAGLDIVMRAPHTRPSAYIRMGFDATVAYPTIDLKLHNPFPFAVVIHARPVRGTLAVSLDTAGGAKSSVSITSEIVERFAFVRVLERDRSLPGTDTTMHVKAFGIPGYRVRRTREVRAADGVVHRDVRVDLYPATNEIVRVAPTFDETRLAKSLSPVTPPEADDGSIGTDAPAPLSSVVDPAAVRPVLVQLRPSTTVVLDNTQ